MATILNFPNETQKVLIEKATEILLASSGSFDTRVENFEKIFAAMFKALRTERPDA